MPGATGDLSGGGPQQVFVWLSYHSMNVAGNYTTWYWELVYKQNGGGHWSSEASHNWSLSGFAASGPHWFAIPSSWAGSGDHVMGSGTFNKGHNAQGYLSAGNLTGTIDTSHSSIGDGSATVGSGTPPRVPKVPSKPPKPLLQSIDSDTVVFTIAQPSDNGGSPVVHYDLQILEEVSSPTDVVQQWMSPTSTQRRGGLSAATTYRIRYRAVTNVGFSSWSDMLTVTTESGVFVSDGKAWKGAGPRVSNGTAWATQVPQISDGTAWADPIDV